MHKNVYLDDLKLQDQTPTPDLHQSSMIVHHFPVILTRSSLISGLFI